MRKLLKWLFVIVLVFALVWAVVVGIWQWTGTNPGGRDLLVYLLALPLLVLIVAITGRAAIAKVRNRKNESGAASDKTAAKDVSPEDTEDWPLHIVGAAVRLSIGDEPNDAMNVLAEGQTRPGLDDELKDGQGFPVFASRISALVDSELEEALELPESHADEPMLLWSVAQRRALSLADELIEEIASSALPELIAQLGPQADDSDDAPAPASDTPRTSPADDDTFEPPRALRLFVVVPNDWSAPYQQAAGRWLKQRLALFAEDDAWPPISVELLAPRHDAQLYQRMERWLRGLASEQANEVALLIGAESAISEDIVAEWDAEDRLFSQANPSGRVPAEGAAALLIATEHSRARLTADQVVTAHRAAVAKRETSIKARGRVDGQALQTVAKTALLYADQTAEDIACILNDAGIDSAHGMETGAITTADFDHLDTSSDCLNIGGACGDLGINACIAALALARARILDAESPVLVLGTQDEFERAALVVAPFIRDDAAEADNQDNESQANAA